MNTARAFAIGFVVGGLTLEVLQAAQAEAEVARILAMTHHPAGQLRYLPPPSSPDADTDG